MMVLKMGVPLFFKEGQNPAPSEEGTGFWF